MSTPQKRPFAEHQDDNENENENDSGNGNGNEVFISAPILDRSSTFTAHFHPLTSPQASSTGQTAKSKSLTSTVKAFQTHPDFAAADHRMVAWRRPSNQRTLGLGPAAAGVGKTICTTGSDDDGEKYAGKRLERVLIDLDVQGTIVVARWYGGILLGPVRFTHIENVAREAIGKWKARQSQAEGQAKRQKMAGGGDEEAQLVAERTRLARQLAERDNSIVVLRGLLAEKTAKHETDMLQDGTLANQGTPTQATASTNSPGSPAKKMDYSEMPLQRLRQLDKARDATIAFILKQIDKAEEEEKEKEQKKEKEKKKKQEGPNEKAKDESEGKREHEADNAQAQDEV
ncbi:hypothetical protein PV05_07824 [Exophiala xenobiotica]|uniref:Impact N-terminal domain-containing protein n=1 Tax=Exophiala xenobiotica TaxID=348802 RepID=A0A0D2CQB0_9EURO|nr:uncharacterized protein PV05_07824 [Exophiala xenobiotica]KIW52162.1 hypothetical protein PV05_07824 [Exophiala xenobiotica]